MNVSRQKITVGKELCNIQIQDAAMCSVTIKKKKFIVPLEVAKFIEDLVQQINVEQNRKAATEADIEALVRKNIGRIANALAGGYENRYGENLLKEPLNAPCPLPPGVEFDDGAKEEPFMSVVIDRIRAALLNEKSFDEVFYSNVKHY